MPSFWIGINCGHHFLPSEIDTAFTVKKWGGGNTPHFPSFYYVIKQNSYLRITPFRGWRRWNVNKTVKQQKCKQWGAKKLHCGPGANWGGKFPSFSGSTSTVPFRKPSSCTRHDQTRQVQICVITEVKIWHWNMWGKIGWNQREKKKRGITWKYLKKD